jgi:hypothetical protein
MVRYVLTAAGALLLLALALLSRRSAATPRPAAPPGPPPVVRIDRAPSGRLVTVRHAVRGSITRAALVYEWDGKDRSAAVETDCRRGRAGSVVDDGFATVLEVSGEVPDGAKHMRLVLESETGTATYDLLEP